LTLQTPPEYSPDYNGVARIVEGRRTPSNFKRFFALSNFSEKGGWRGDFLQI